MEPVYAWLPQHGKNDDFSQLTTFNVDDYVGMASDHPQSYRQNMVCHLFDVLYFDPIKTHLPRGDAESPQAEADRYERLIRDTGGIELQLFGIGTNGQIGFNDRGRPHPKR